MELIVISDKRLKIMLSADDMSAYNINALTLDTDNNKTKRILYDILDRAKRNAGFESDTDRVFVQIFPSREGGCEMFVTKFSDLYDYEEVDNVAVAHLHQAKGNAVKKRLVYRFWAMGDLLCACRALKNRKYKELSEVYASAESDAVYLMLCEGEGACDISVVCEYADPVFFPGISLYISEHCIPICEGDAVGKLSQLC